MNKSTHTHAQITIDLIFGSVLLQIAKQILFTDDEEKKPSIDEEKIDEVVEKI